MRNVVTRIGLSPLLIDLVTLFHFLGCEGVVIRQDRISLQFAGSLPQIIGLLEVLVGHATLSEISVRSSQVNVGHSKARVQLRGPLEQRESSGVAFLLRRRFAVAVGLQRLKR